MIRKILFATDLGPYTPLALVHVEALARQFDAEVCFVHAVPPLSEFTNAVVKSYCSDAVKREILRTRNIRGIIESVRDEVFDLVSADAFVEDNFLLRIGDIVVVQGKAAPTILFEAERLGVDLIVIGSHGSDTINEHVLGSVTTKVLQLAKVPVFLVPMMAARGAVIQSGGDDIRSAM